MIGAAEMRDAYAGKRVLVLGAAGFIGRWVARILSRCGAGLHLVVRNPAVAERIFSRYDVSGRLVELDLDDFARLRQLALEFRPSITFNLAGYGVDRAERDVGRLYRINAELVAELCDAIARSRDSHWPGAELVHAGSIAEYGFVAGPLLEDCAAEPATEYGKSKLAGTRTVEEGSRASGVRSVCARLATVYGPGEHPGRLLPSLIEAAASGDPLALTAGAQCRDFTYVEDVAEGLLRLGTTPAKPGGLVNLVTGRPVAVRTFVEIAASVLAIPPDQLRFGAVPVRADEEMNHLPISTERLLRLTGWVPATGIEDGVRRTVHFLRQQNLPAPR